MVRSLLPWLLLCAITALTFNPRAFAQEEPQDESGEDSGDGAEDEEKVQPDGWTRGFGFGVDLGQLLLVNPRIGAGENRIGVGANLTAYARLKRGRLHWDNTGSLNFAIQRLGSGVLPPPFDVGSRVPWQKSIDDLRLTSQVDYAFAEEGEWGYGVESTFLSQITQTYQDSTGRNILGAIDGANAGGPIAEFLSPVTFTLSPGITYRPTEHFDLLFSPASFKAIIVADETIRKLPIYDYLAEGGGGGGRRALVQLGASLRANYQNTYLEDDRLLLKTSLGLFSNYLSEPQNVDVDWRTDISYEIFEGLTISLNTILLYDDDVPVQITNYDLVGGIERGPDKGPRLGKRPSFTEQLLVTYAVVF